MHKKARQRWAISIAATLASGYALEAIATATGAALVISPLLDGIADRQLSAFLGLSYLIWAAGLWVNLGANWALLQATGSSTSAISLAAYEIARRRTDSRRACRFATDAGYVATEIIKELPYYAAALGAAALSEDVTTRDALIFVAGTNLGAAAYECSLGVLTRLGLACHPMARVAGYRLVAAPAVRHP